MNGKRIIKLVILLYLATGVPVGLIFCLLGKALMHTTQNKAETTAVISYITQEPYESNHNIHVTYTVDGVTYTEKLSRSSLRDQVGRKVRILYDPSNPQKIFGDIRWMFRFMIRSGAYVCITNSLGTLVMLIVLIWEKSRRHPSANEKKPPAIST